ncbi:DUF6056 family protein [Streptomyces sp. NBC_00503]|uniref:DUF6056 family protein n=1 Tax=Streptomyces sp. NBC_00503 TaxID=2903659 RepID=UPI002E8197CD|nr:hypothetical protein [Streptomyces sp. NBC_00503]WUD84928.1 DUF6056 family protein [Streptomyces sp. NBC_00503]
MSTDVTGADKRGFEGEGDPLTDSPAAVRGSDRRAFGRGFMLGTAGILVTVSGALVAVGCFLGLYVRPTSDDWCAAWKSRDMGVFGITSDFYMTQNGRVANAFLSGVIYGDGLIGTKILPTVIAVTFTLGLVLLGAQFMRFLGARPRLLLLTATALVLQALIYFAGTRNYQVLLWAPATISHTVPSAIGVWALLLGIWTVRRPNGRARTFGFVATFLIAAALGTLSEPFTLVTGLLGAGAGLLAIPRFRLATTWRPFTWCLTWCLGLLSGLLLLYTSPGARWRRAQNPSKESLLTRKGLRATTHDWLLMWDSVTGQWAYLGAAAAGILIGLAIGLRTTTGRRALDHTVPRLTRIALWLLPALVVVLGSFAVAAGLRSGYGPTGWTYARTWTNYLVPMVLALCAYGALLGQWAGRHLASRATTTRYAPLAVIATGAFALASMATLVPAVQTLTTTTVTRSVAWDAQNARIEKEARQGTTDVGYKPLYIGNLAEPFYTKNYQRDWVSACVSKWYDIDRIHRR